MGSNSQRFRCALAFSAAYRPRPDCAHRKQWSLPTSRRSGRDSSALSQDIAAPELDSAIVLRLLFPSTDEQRHTAAPLVVVDFNLFRIRFARNWIIPVRGSRYLPKSATPCWRTLMLSAPIVMSGNAVSASLVDLISLTRSFFTSTPHASFFTRNTIFRHAVPILNCPMQTPPFRKRDPGCRSAGHATLSLLTREILGTALVRTDRIHQLCYMAAACPACPLLS
jgi:hypothetical protein